MTTNGTVAGRSGRTLAITALATVALIDGAAAGMFATDSLTGMLPGPQSLAHLSVVGAAFVLPALLAGIVLALRRIARTLGAAWLLVAIGGGMLAAAWLAGDATALMHAFVGALRGAIA